MTRQRVFQLLNNILRKLQCFQCDRAVFVTRLSQTLGAQETRWPSDANESGISAFHGDLHGIKGTHLIPGELEPRIDDGRQARVMIMLGGLHADKHVVEIRGERCHSRRSHRRRHRRLLAD